MFYEQTVRIEAVSSYLRLGRVVNYIIYHIYLAVGKCYPTGVSGICGVASVVVERNYAVSLLSAIGCFYAIFVADRKEGVLRNEGVRSYSARDKAVRNENVSVGEKSADGTVTAGKI